MNGKLPPPVWEDGYPANLSATIEDSLMWMRAHRDYIATICRINRSAKASIADNLQRIEQCIEFMESYLPDAESHIEKIIESA